MNLSAIINLIDEFSRFASAEAAEAIQCQSGEEQRRAACHGASAAYHTAASLLNSRLQTTLQHEIDRLRRS